LKRFKCKFESKNSGKEGVRVHYLACNTLGVRGACWSSRMGTRTNDKWVNYSHGLAQTKQQVG